MLVVSSKPTHDRFQDLSSQRFGRLVVIEYAGYYPRKPRWKGSKGFAKRHAWHCLCDCGQVAIVKTESLKRKTTRSCGCFQRDKARQVRRRLEGSQYGDWKVLNYEGCGRYLCECSCGTKASRVATTLTSGISTSCGCKHRRWGSKHRMTHGMTGTKVYAAWSAMKGRCYLETNKCYSTHGARGIKVCDNWRQSFEKFYEDMGDPPTPSHSLDRINPDGDYEPANCRWATAAQQGHARRTTTLLTFDGVTLSITQWAKRRGLNMNTLWARLKRGWPLEKALQGPPSQDGDVGLT